MDTQICPKCDTPNITQSAWCEKCLHPFRRHGQDQVISCPNCNHENSYEEKYCEECYEPLKPGQVE